MNHIKEFPRAVFLTVLLCFASVLALAGCGKQEQPWTQAGITEDFYWVTEDFCGKYLTLDRDGARYDQALDAVQDYLDGSADHVQTVELLEDAADFFQQELDGFEEVVLDDTLKEQLQNCGISATEYEAFSNSRPSNLQSHIQRLNTLLFYLEHSETDEHSRQNLEFFLASDRAEQDCMRGYHYYGCLNYWFTQADEAERAYLQEKVIDQLASYIPEDPVWYQTRENAEQCTMVYLDGMEAVVAQSSLHLGEEQDALYDMQQEYALLQSAIEEYLEMQQTLVRLWYINDQIVALEPQILAAKEANDQQRLDELEVEFKALVAEYEELTAS